MSKAFLKLALAAGAAHLLLIGGALASESAAFPGADAAMAAGAEAATTANPESATDAGAALAAQAPALRAVRDKATGQLRAPTADELKAMIAAERAARKARGLPEVETQAPLVVRQHVGGMRSARLGPDYLVTLKGERRADGSVRRFHEQGGPAHADAHDHRPTE